MSLTLKQIKYFLAVSEAGQVSAAARNVNVSQSAMTLAIRDLEAALGACLFERRSTGLVLTREGHRFHTHAAGIQEQVGRAFQSVHSTGDPLTGNIRVGATDTLSGYFLMPTLAKFHREHPGVRVDLIEAERAELEQLLLRQEIDLALLLSSNIRTQDKLTVDTFHRSPRRLWTSAGHPLSERSEVSIKDLEDYPVVLLRVDEVSENARLIWSSFGLKPNVVFESNSIEAVRNMVGQGLAITVLSDVVYRPWTVDGLRVVKRDLVEALPTMDVGIARRATDDLSPALSTFRDAFLDGQ